MKGLKLMYSYKLRPVGIGLSLVGLLGMVTERVHPVLFNHKWNAAQHYSLFVWLMLGGLFVMAYCKERYDDERAQQIRLKAFQISFMILMSTVLALGLTLSIAQPSIKSPDDALQGTDLYFLAGLGIISYLLIFYSGIYLDKYWDFGNKDKSVLRNILDIPKNIGGLLLYLLVFALTLVILLLINA